MRYFCLLAFTLFVIVSNVCSADDSSSANAPSATAAVAQPAVPTNKFVSAGIIRDYTSADGSIILFRVLGGEYDKTFVDSPEFKKTFAFKEGSFAYSLSPFIAQYWGPMAATGEAMLTSRTVDIQKATIVIAKQNVASDGLLYPGPESLNTKIYFPLTLDTPIKNISFLNEIRVPFKKENVIAVMRYVDFEAAVKTAGRGINPFRFAELLKQTSCAMALR